MAPIKLHPHSCEHCQRLIVDESQRAKANRDSEERNFIHFNFTASDIIAGDADGCSLCTWLLDEEWIHRSAIVDPLYTETRVRAGYEAVLAAVAEASIRIDERMPPTNPDNTLRRFYAQTGAEEMVDLRLAYFCNDNLVIKFFGLWNTVARHMVYRSRSGFSFFASPGNPASRMIPTRPVEEEAEVQEVLEKAAAWLSECLHGKIRGNRIHAVCPTPREDYMPTRLIEITNNQDQFELKVRKMKGCPTEPYSALSYCWGGDQATKSTQALLPQWMISIPWDKLPQTLRDAVIVCDKLHIRFLWVDAFCIVQDDPNHKAQEIAQMTKVYRNSIFTIAASRAPSVQEGFLGKRIATEFPDLVFELPYQVTRPPALGSITLIKTKIEREPLDTRGWALQERLLSPRTIEFGSRQLRCICQHNPRGITDGWRRHPEANSSRKDKLGDMVVLQLEFDALQDRQAHAQRANFEEAMENWFSLVKVYSHRCLTLPTDRILAISGIAERYGRVFGDQYCAGLWRSTFAKALYWKSTHEGGKMHPRPQVWQGPSWSWISVNGPVEFPMSTSTGEHEPQIIAVDIELANPADPYGALLEGSGRLTVRARKSPAVLRFREGRDGVMQVLAGSISMGGGNDIFEIPITYDAFETEEERSENDAVFLELSSVSGTHTWSTKGLIARGDGNDIFTRIGTFDYTASGGRGRQNGESLEAWQKRMYHEFCWFSGNEEEVVDII